MKQFKLLIFAFILMGTAVGFSSCDDDEEPQNNLVGTWTVDEIDASISGNDFDLNGSGTMTFNADNSGSRNYSFTTAGNTLNPQDSFTWADDGAGEITITNVNGGVETWTQNVNTASSQELFTIQNINSIVHEMTFTLSK